MKPSSKHIQSVYRTVIQTSRNSQILQSRLTKLRVTKPYRPAFGPLRPIIAAYAYSTACSENGSDLRKKGNNYSSDGSYGYNKAFIAGLMIGSGYLAWSIIDNYPILLEGHPSRSNADGNSPAVGGSFATSSYNGISKQYNKQGLFIFTEKEVTRRLREFEESFIVKRGKGVARYDICQLPSNNPIEDDRSEKTIQVPITASDKEVNSDWMFWGIYDGHSGWTTSAKLRDSLIDYVVNELSTVYKSKPINSGSQGKIFTTPSPATIDRAIKLGFTKLDDEIVNKSVEKLLANPTKAGAAELIMPALSGSCGLLSFYDSYTKQLRVAVTGDSRAVLGSLNAKGQWTAKALSVDQTGSNKDEEQRLRSEHPGEPRVINRGRVLGNLEPTRAFGDARYKWTADIQEKLTKNFFGRSSPAELKTPPYVTAEPVVSTTNIKPENGDFMVIGSDGLYELLSNDEIVGLVVQWMDKNNYQFTKNERKINTSSGLNIWNSLMGSKNIETSNSSPFPRVVDISSNSNGKPPFRRRAKQYFTVEDENAATHIIRNALGGGDKEQVAMLVSIPSPLSRRYRDDLTVTVVFFGDKDSSNDSGKIEINNVATKNGIKNVEAKL